MADESKEPNANETQDQQGQAREEKQPLTDKHGEPAISKGRYDREMQAKDELIEALKAQLAESTQQAQSGADALKEVQQLKAQLADEKLDHALELAGCVNAKAAKALLDDYAGDVGQLRAACPYLFKQQAGSTGAKPGGAPGGSDFGDKLDRAFGIKRH